MVDRVGDDNGLGDRGIRDEYIVKKFERVRLK